MSRFSGLKTYNTMKWVVYCRNCRKEIAAPIPNGQWIEGQARLHKTEGLTYDGSPNVTPGHTVIVGYIFE